MRGIVTTLMVAVAFVGLLGRPVIAATKGEELVEESRFTLERLRTEKNMVEFQNFLGRAKGVLIIPELVKGGFIFGAEGGSGVLLVRGADGSWSSPAFYTLAAGSFGLQIGAQVSEVVFTLMSEGAISAFMSDEFKLGADASVAIGPLGAGIEASTTTNLNADIYAFSRAVGLFGGGALEGAKIFSRTSWDDEYYGAKTTPREIVLERKFFNTQADALRKALP